MRGAEGFEFGVEVIRQFNEVRAKSIKFAQETQAPLKEHICEHPFPVFKTLNAGSDNFVVIARGPCQAPPQTSKLEKFTEIDLPPSNSFFAC